VRVWPVVVATAALGASACNGNASFHCDTDPQCGAGGTCQQAVGYCSFADSMCQSGQRYDDYAGGGLGGTCVEAAAVDAPSADAAIDAAPPIDAFAPLVYRVHVGGPEVIGTDYPGTWAADTAHTTCPDATVFTTATAINGTVDDVLFQSEVYKVSQLVCAVPALPSGMYQVRLLFAELYYDCSVAGDHLFDVTLEGEMVGSTLSSRSDGGGCATAAGHPFPFAAQIPVTDGQLDITITGQASQCGIVTGIEVIRVQ